MEYWRSMKINKSKNNNNSGTNNCNNNNEVDHNDDEDDENVAWIDAVVMILQVSQITWADLKM